MVFKSIKMNHIKDLLGKFILSYQFTHIDYFECWFHMKKYILDTH